MADQTELERLTADFARLGAQDPELWAHSQLSEGIPQLARFVFLKGAWDSIVDAHDDSWMDRHASAENADVGFRPLGRLLVAGVDRGDLHEVVREMQQGLLFSLCYMLGDSGAVVGNDVVKWAFFELDDDGNPLDPIHGLHESVIETDPANRG